MSFVGKDDLLSALYASKYKQIYGASSSPPENERERPLKEGKITNSKSLNNSSAFDSMCLEKVEHELKALRDENAQMKAVILANGLEMPKTEQNKALVTVTRPTDSISTEVVAEESAEGSQNVKKEALFSTLTQIPALTLSVTLTPLRMDAIGPHQL